MQYKSVLKILVLKNAMKKNVRVKNATNLC